ncbi:MAG: protein kinase [Deltaproteobacteria bacterium]|nr:protein kinase [Deltaproteobacteria bacterium]
MAKVQALKKNHIIDNRYSLEKLLQESGGSFVYLATDLKTENKVILKYLDLKHQGEKNVFRLKEEMHILLKLSHPGVVKILDLGEVQDCLYFVTEYIEGLTLREILSRHKISIEESIKWTIDLIEIINYLHQNLIIHRDLKPENIIFDSKGNIKILDFGLARLLTIDDYFEKEALVGSLAYIPPEQTGLFRHISDVRSDLYSLGVILYEFLSGAPPFQSQDAGVLIHDHLTKQPPSLTQQKNKQVPEILEKIVFKLLSKDPSERYQTGEGLIHDLKIVFQKLKEGRSMENFPLGKVDRTGKLMHELPLMGRKNVINTLRSQVNQLKQNKGSVTFLLGEAGIGKTRILNELRSYATLSQCIIISGKGHVLLTRFPYAPIQQAIREYVQLYANFSKKTRDQIKKAIEDELEDLLEVVLEFVPELKLICNETTVPISPLSPERARERLFNCVNSLWKAIASVHPLILFLDDLHGVDHETLQMLRKTVSSVDHTPIQLMITYRPSEAPEWLESFSQEFKKFEKTMEIKLSPLKENDIVELCHEILMTQTSWVEELGKHIYSRSEGNPLYITQIFRTLFEKEILYLKENKWQLNKIQLLKTPFPEEILSFFIERLKRVTPVTKKILRIASAIGEEWTQDLLMHVYPNPLEVHHSLEEAKKAQLIEESLFHMGTYNFLHDRIQEAIYQEVPDEQKKHIHKLVGTAIEKSADKDRPLAIYKLAHHFFHAKIPEKIVHYSVRAGKVATHSYATQEALVFFNRALTFMRSDEFVLKDEVLEEKADINLLIGNYSDAEKIYSDLLLKKVSVLDKCRLYRKRGDLFFRKGAYEKSIENAEKALQFLGARMPSSTPGLVLAFLKTFMMRFFHRRFPRYFFGRKKHSKQAKIFQEQNRIHRALSLTYWFVTPIKGFLSCQRYLNVADDVGQEKEVAQASSIYSVYLAVTPFKKRALHYARKALAIHIKNADVFGVAQTHSCMGIFYYHNGYPDKAIECTEKAIEGCEKIGDAWELSNAIGFKALCWWIKGDLRKALENFKIAFNIATEVQDISFRTKILPWIGLLEALRGNKEKAFKCIHQTLKMIDEIKDVIGQIILYDTAAAVYLLFHNFEKAIEYGEKATGLIKKFKIRIGYVQGAPLTLAEAYLEKWKEKKDKELKKKVWKMGKQILKVQRYPNHGGWALRVYGDICTAFGKHAQAKRVYKKSIESLHKLGAKNLLGQTYFSYAELLLAQAESNAIHYLYLAKDIFEECDDQYHLNLLCSKYQQLIQRKDMQLEKVKRNRRLETIIKVSNYLSSIRHLPTLLSSVMESLIELFGGERGFIMLKDNDGKLQIRISRHVDTSQVSGDEFSLSQKILQKVYKEAKGIVVIDAQTDPQFKTSKSVTKYGLRSVLCVPLKVEKETLGIIYIDNRIITNLFTKDDLEILNVFATQVAIAIQNSLAFNELDQLRRSLEEKVNLRTQELTKTHEVIQEKMEELKQAYEKLKTLTNLKDVFFGLCSHNLKNPLMIIQHCIESFSTMPARHHGKFLDIISRQTQRMTRLTEQFLNISQLDSEKFSLQYKNVFLKELIRNVFEDTKIIAQSRGIHINLKIEDLVENMTCDPDRIREVIENLLINALKFTSLGGTITLKARAIKENGEEFVEVSVTDTGQGISQEKISHIFDRFQTPEMPVEKSEKGSGLGLFLCKRIVALHGGNICVKSVYGKGSTFTFRIPRKRIIKEEQLKKAA